MTNLSPIGSGRIKVRGQPSASLTLLLAILLSLQAAAPAPAQSQAEGGFPMGINLTSVCYWSTENPFIDIFKQSQPWQPQRKGTGYGKGGPLDLDRNGWIRSLQPGQWADTLICRGYGYYPAGKYVCLYNGEGRVEFGFDAKIKQRQEGRVVLTVTPSKSGILMKITATNPPNPVRNIRIIPFGIRKHLPKTDLSPRFPETMGRFQGDPVHGLDAHQ